MVAPLENLTYDWSELRGGLGNSIPSITVSAFKPDTKQGFALHDLVSEVTTQLEKALIQHVLQETNGNKTQAAKLLKIGYKTLYRKMREHAID
jgi:two-component system, NtrC family, response regulator HydG